MGTFICCILEAIAAFAMNLSFPVQGKHRSKMIECGISRLLVFPGDKAGAADCELVL